MFIGSSVGSSIPSFWGDGYLSLSSVLLGGVGALIGIWIGYRIG